MRIGAAMLGLLAGTLPVSSVAFAQVTPDGATDTTVSADPSGKIRVRIAPPANRSGISRNTYRAFSISQTGVALDNRAAAARTILNEVTSTRTSRLAGPLEVEGNRAHVIIANPNGITVDGATFTNTGGVALATGKPSIVTREPVPNAFQDNVVLKTEDGRIEVGPGGLAALADDRGGVSQALVSLQLIAGQIRIDGPVESRSDNPRSGIELIAGGSRVEYDSSILPTSAEESWGIVEETGSPDSGTAVEITSRGSLKANTVRIRATDQGAGVSHAGKGLASLGDFVIDAKGRIDTTGSIKASRDVRIEASTIAAKSSPGGPQSTIEAVNGALTLLARTGDITNTGVLMSGNRRIANGRSPRDPAPERAVTLTAAGDVSLLTANPDHLAIVFSAACIRDNAPCSKGDGDLRVTAGGSILNNTGRFVSNATTQLAAAGDVVNRVDVLANGPDSGEWVYDVTTGKRLWYTFWQKRKRTETASLSYGVPRIDGQQAYIIGADVTIKADGDVLNAGGSINANDGDVTVTGQALDNQAVPSGTLTYTKTCGLFCTGYGTSDIAHIGGAINATGDIFLNAADYVHDRGGQITAYRDIDIEAPEIALEGLRVPSIHRRPPGLYNFWSGSYAWIAQEDRGGVVIAPQGSVRIDAFLPVMVDAGLIQARDGVHVPSGINHVAPPGEFNPIGDEPVGLFRRLVGK